MAPSLNSPESFTLKKHRRDEKGAKTISAQGLDSLEGPWIPEHLSLKKHL